MLEFAVYTAARLGIFVACWAVVTAVAWVATGADRVPVLGPLLVAAVLSMVLSTYLLRGMRERFAAAIQQRSDARREP